MSKLRDQNKRLTGANQELEHRLRSYALVALGASVGLLPHSAKAAVVYTPVDVSVVKGTLLIDMNADSIDDFIIFDEFIPVSHHKHRLIGIRKLLLHGDAGAGVISSNQGVAVLSSGATIGSSRTFVDAHQGELLMVGGRSYAIGSTGTCCFEAYGNWKGEQRRYVGLKFTFGGETHYGWARFSVRLPFEVTAPIKATLTGYAYESNPGQSIVAGDTGTSASTSPAAGTLGALARGTAGTSSHAK